MPCRLSTITVVYIIVGAWRAGRRVFNARRGGRAEMCRGLPDQHDRSFYIDRPIGVGACDDIDICSGRGGVSADRSVPSFALVLRRKYFGAPAVIDSECYKV